MTEKHCESVNECANGELCAMLKNSAGLTLVGCSHFKPKKPMTNEEWFCGLSAEEKAKAIVCLAHNANALATEYHCADVEALCVWLKEVHHD